MPDQEMVTITAEEYASLKEDSDMLLCLQDAGVDNWIWYDEARAAFDKLSRD
jgi:hypothetical protein